MDTLRSSQPKSRGNRSSIVTDSIGTLKMAQSFKNCKCEQQPLPYRKPNQSTTQKGKPKRQNLGKIMAPHDTRSVFSKIHRAPSEMKARKTQDQQKIRPRSRRGSRNRKHTWLKHAGPTVRDRCGNSAGSRLHRPAGRTAGEPLWRRGPGCPGCRPFSGGACLPVRGTPARRSNGLRPVTCS